MEFLSGWRTRQFKRSYPLTSSNGYEPDFWGGDFIIDHE